MTNNEEFNMAKVAKGIHIYVAAIFLLKVSFSQCNLTGVKELRWGKRLPNVLIDTVYGVSFLDCVEDCISRRRCLSVNYQRKNLLCELNYLYSIPFMNAPSEIVKKLEDEKSFVFADIESWNKKIAGSCSSQPCAVNEKCARESFTQNKCKVSDCGPLQHQGNGTEILMKTTVVKIGVGARRAFTCTTGYQPSSLTSMYNCNGTWQGVRLDCIACENGCFIPAYPPLYNNDIFVTRIGSNLVTVPPFSSGDYFWRVIQKRIDGREQFYRPWIDYKAGFGTINHEFWIGNDNLHFLTSSGYTYLRIDMEDGDGNESYAEYSTFKVSDESQKYQLTVDGYNGNAGDSMTVRHNGMYFSTFDKDNDEWDYNCARRYKGGWWYTRCHDSNLNGEYGNNKHGEGINWKAWRGHEHSLKSVTMLIRKP